MCITEEGGEMKEIQEKFEVNRYMVMKFEDDQDSLVQYSQSMSLGNCRKYISKMRVSFPNWDFSIVAVLDE